MPANMNVVFMGTPEFAVPSLEKLSMGKHPVLSVVTGPDKRRGRGAGMTPTPVKKAALARHLPVIETDDVRSEVFIRELESLKPDVLVVVAFRILPARILAIPRKGSINLHASLLPKYRGAAPIHRAVINGDTETGCTIFFLDEKVDQGKILLQRKTSIGFQENTGEVYDRLKMMGSELVADALDLIASGSYTLSEQDESEASSAPKVFPEEAYIDFSGDARAIHNLIRGMNPSPGAWTTIEGKRLKIHRAKPAVCDHLERGRVEVADGAVVVGCESGCIELTEVQLQGKSRLPAFDFFNGYRGNPALAR